MEGKAPATVLQAKEEGMRGKCEQNLRVQRRSLKELVVRS